jgi:hypothetical protein
MIPSTIPSMIQAKESPKRDEIFVGRKSPQSEVYPPFSKFFSMGRTDPEVKLLFFS